MPARTPTTQHANDHPVATPPLRAFPAREHRHEEAPLRTSRVAAFVARTTAASGVPLLVDDEAVIAQLVRLIA
jgi:hypothetical protein